MDTFSPYPIGEPNNRMSSIDCSCALFLLRCMDTVAMSLHANKEVGLVHQLVVEHVLWIRLELIQLVKTTST